MIPQHQMIIEGFGVDSTDPNEEFRASRAISNQDLERESMNKLNKEYGIENWSIAGFLMSVWNAIDVKVYENQPKFRGDN